VDPNSSGAGSGKTYTILGSGGHPGVVPRVLEELFTRVAAVRERTDMQCTLRCSMLEAGFLVSRLVFVHLC
jgi:hypothetical protein